MLFSGRKASEIDQLKKQFADLKERSELLDQACGIGLWESVLYDADALHPKSVWNWSPGTEVIASSFGLSIAGSFLQSIDLLTLISFGLLITIPS